MDEQSISHDRAPRHKNEIGRALHAFSPLERLVFICAMLISAVAVLSLLYKINEHFLVSVPVEGGTLHEGVVGTPRFVNPLLAVTDADRDLTALVYRGLMKTDGSGAIVPDLAKSYTVSPDGLTYTFVLGDAAFSDGQKVTADDVLFTIKSAEDATLKSAERIAWEGVLASATDESTITFTLKQPFAPFLASTTLGILPKHVWSKVPYDSWAYSDFNTKNAVGEGAFKIMNIKESASGVPDYYELAAVRQKDGPDPHIDSIQIHFYASEDALIAAYRSRTIDTLGGIDPENAKLLEEDGAKVLSAPLPRVFGLFFNQSQAKLFTDPSVRRAISLALDKDNVVATVLKGYGSTDSGPIPESSQLATAPNLPAAGADIDAAKAALEKSGWKLGPDGMYAKQISKKETERASFEIATNDTPELTQAVNLIAKDLLAAGIEAVPKVYETGSLNQDIIRPRKFQALFFGEVVSSQSDLYAFWHSSQRNDPGLNISGYANSKADKLLVQGLQTLDPEKTADTYNALVKEINTDMPAVFVYSPSYIYVVRPGLTGITLGHVETPEDRFADISTWYLATDRVWKIFAKPESSKQP